MNIYVYHHGNLITYPDLPDTTDAEEFVADHFPLGEIQWGEYEEEEVRSNNCNICDDRIETSKEEHDRRELEYNKQQTIFQNLHKEMEQDGF